MLTQNFSVARKKIAEISGLLGTLKNKTINK